jgi:hypothetical protein
MTDNAYEDDPRTPAELIAAWVARPSREDAGPVSFAKSTELRGALFAKLHCPESIRKPKGRAS